MVLKNIEIKECPYCGGTEFGEGRQRGHAKLVTSTFALTGEDVYHTVCINCGSIVRSFIKGPENFKK